MTPDTDFAVVVGIDDYPEYKSLQGAKRDAEAVANWLTSSSGGGVAPDRCHVVLSSDPPPEPVQDKIDRAFKRVLDGARALPGGARRLYFYFSGHGMAEDPDDVSLCLAGWSEEMRRAALSHQGYRTVLKSYGLFQQFVQWLDCCRVRNINVRGKDPNFAPVRPRDGAGQVRDFVAYATEFQSPAYEDQRGLFTRALLGGLTHGDRAGPGRGVTAPRLAALIDLETRRLALERGIYQNARVINEFLDAPEFDFGPAESVIGAPVAAPKRKARIRIVFRPGRNGELQLETGDMEIVRRGRATDGHWDLELTRGVYVLSDRSTGEERHFRVRGELPDGGQDAFEF